MDYEYFMKKALDRAEHALAGGEFPVGCVIVHQNKILAAGTRKGTIGGGGNEIDHAEMVALRGLLECEDQIKSGRITVFCTMEPCLMCYGALILAGIDKIGEGVHLVHHLAIFVPHPPFCAGTTHVRHGVDETTVDQAEPGGPERGIIGDAVRSITVQQQR